MKRFRLSIAGLMATIPVLACGFAGFRSNSDLVAGAFHSLVITSLAIATLASLIKGRRSGAPWAGFAICGWVYYACGEIRGPYENCATFPELLAYKLMDHYGLHPVATSDIGAVIQPAYHMAKYTFVLAFGVAGAFLGAALAETGDDVPARD
jgi:hypothetical protein